MNKRNKIIIASVFFIGSVTLERIINNFNVSLPQNSVIENSVVSSDVSSFTETLDNLILDKQLSDPKPYATAQNSKSEQADIYFNELSYIMGTFFTLNPSLASFDGYLSRLADSAELDVESLKINAADDIKGRFTIPNSKISVGFTLDNDCYKLEIDLEEYVDPRYKSLGISDFGFFAFYSGDTVTKLSGSISLPWAFDNSSLDITGYNYGFEDGKTTLEPLAVIRLEEKYDNLVNSNPLRDSLDIVFDHVNSAPYDKWLNKLMEIRNTYTRTSR